MNTYSSREPFNDDPYPNVWAGHSERDQMRTDTDMFRKGSPRYLGYAGNYIVRPRPEFVRPQHNPTNPILLSFRANDLNPDPKQWVEGLRIPGLGPWYYADRKQIDHARKVLTRLAALKEEA